jgi:hypothetical protein
VDQFIATYNADLAGYRQTVLTAFHQVEDNLAAVRILSREIQKLQQSVGEHPLVANSLMALSRALREVERKTEAKIDEAWAAQILSSHGNPLHNGRNTIDIRAFQAANRWVSGAVLRHLAYGSHL